MRVYSFICFKLRIKKYPYVEIAAGRAEVTVRVLFLVVCDVKTSLGLLRQCDWVAVVRTVTFCNC